jgi:hypothetical protein
MYVALRITLAGNASGILPASLEAVRSRSLLPIQAFSATLLVFHGVFSKRFCVLALGSQVCD